MNLFKASNQWATRPADERFWTVTELHQACRGYRAQAQTAAVPYRTLRARAQGPDVLLVGQTNRPAHLTHWAFGQLAQRAGAPASYLRTLPAPLAAECVNTGLTAREDGDTAHLLLHPNGGLLCRAMVSEDYTRIWNSDITARLLKLEEQGWRVPPARPSTNGGPTRPATQQDVLRARGNGGLSVNVGDLIAPAGLYASDHDLFAFLVREDRLINGGDGDILSRGFFIWNSEVGASSLGIMSFLYDYVCGNHIVWGARGVKELRITHRGDADERAFRELRGKLVEYADASVSEDEARITRAKQFSLGKDKAAVLDAVFGLRIPALSRVRIGEAFDLAEQHENAHGASTTAWGLASGLTRLSQTLPYADDRVTLDRAAGRVLEVAF